MPQPPERSGRWDAVARLRPLISDLCPPRLPRLSASNFEENRAASTMTKRNNFSSGTDWERRYGYSRAVRVGNLVYVAGTTAVDEHGVLVGAGSAYEQARFILGKIERALEMAGASLQDVVRTAIYATEVQDLLEAGRAHGEVFQDIRPAATGLVVKNLISPELLVEIEATAIVESA